MVDDFTRRGFITTLGGVSVTGAVNEGEDVAAITGNTRTTVPPTLLWANSYGGGDRDRGFGADETADGSLLVAGFTESAGGGDRDGWLLKTAADGTLQWQRTYGGDNFGMLRSVSATSDGGALLGGYRDSEGDRNGWLINVDSDGPSNWDQSFGGSSGDGITSVLETNDGNFVFAGFYGGGASRNQWLGKVDPDGTLLWDQTYGGNNNEVISQVIETSDGGYLLTGHAWAGGSRDLTLLKVDSEGTRQWQETYGGDYRDQATTVVESSSGGYLLAGWRRSSGEGRDSRPSDADDAWVIKTDTDGTVQWENTFGGSGWDRARSVIETSDNGYLIGANSTSDGGGESDGWLIKLDSEGTKEWDEYYGGTGRDRVKSVIQTDDGNYLFAGFTDSSGSGADDAWMVKIEPDGGGDPTPSTETTTTTTTTTTSPTTTTETTSTQATTTTTTTSTTTDPTTRTESTTQEPITTQAGQTDPVTTDPSSQDGGGIPIFRQFGDNGGVGVAALGGGGILLGLGWLAISRSRTDESGDEE